MNIRSGNTPLMDSRFVQPLLDNFSTGNEKLAICAVSGVICCMAIIAKTRIGVWETFQPSQAPLGSWIQDTAVSTAELGQTLRNALPAPSLIMGITQQDPRLLSRPESRQNINTIDYIATARVPVDGTFEDYWSKRGKNLRQNLRRQRNRLSREEVNVELCMIKDPDSIHAAVTAYGSLESAGWKSTENTAIHIDNSQGKFYSTMLQNFAKLGQAIVVQYKYDNELAATDFCILGGDSFIILKTTYDESITTTSPAMLMREDTFNYVFTDKVAKNIEFYGKLMDWHTKWAEDVRTMYHINVYSSLTSGIRAIYSCIFKRTKA